MHQKNAILGYSIKTYKSPYFIQRGRGTHYLCGQGLGGFFKGFARIILPYIKAGTRSIAKEIFTSGLDVLEDLKSNPESSLKSILTKRAQTGLKNLSEQAKKNIMGGRVKKRLKSILKKNSCKGRVAMEGKSLLTAKKDKELNKMIAKVMRENKKSKKKKLKKKGETKKKAAKNKKRPMRDQKSVKIAKLRGGGKRKRDPDIFDFLLAKKKKINK